MASASTGTQVGFIGLGNMGGCMARNLALHSPPHEHVRSLMVWNRTSSKAEDLIKAVGKERVCIANDPEEIAIKCDIIIVSLANDDAVKRIYDRLFATLKENKPVKNKIFVETSTIYPALAGELDAMISTLPRCCLVTCPVLGTPVAADTSQLLLSMSGDYVSKKRIEHLLVPAVGRKVLDLGGDLERAPTFKLIANSIILGNNEILAEAFTLAEKSGIEAQNIYSLIEDYFPAPSILAYADKMVHDKFDGTAGFSIDGGIKDVTHIRRMTSKYNCPMPAIDVAHQHLLTARALHLKQKQEGTVKFDTLDWSGIIAGPRLTAGLNGLDKDEDTELVQEII